MAAFQHATGRDCIHKFVMSSAFLPRLVIQHSELFLIQLALLLPGLNLLEYWCVEACNRFRLPAVRLLGEGRVDEACLVGSADLTWSSFFSPRAISVGTYRLTTVDIIKI